MFCSVVLNIDMYEHLPIFTVWIWLVDRPIWAHVDIAIRQRTRRTVLYARQQDRDFIPSILLLNHSMSRYFTT